MTTTNPNHLPILPCYPETKVLSRTDLQQRAKDCGYADDLTGFLAARTFGDESEAGRKRADLILQGKDPEYLVVWNDREAKLIEEARVGLRAVSRILNGSADLAVRVVAGEIGGDHRALQSTWADVLLKALRVVGEREPGMYFDARNDWLRGLAEKLAAI